MLGPIKVCCFSVGHQVQEVFRTWYSDIQVLSPTAEYPGICVLVLKDFLDNNGVLVLNMNT